MKDKTVPNIEIKDNDNIAEIVQSIKVKEKITFKNCIPKLICWFFDHKMEDKKMIQVWMHKINDGDWKEKSNDITVKECTRCNYIPSQKASITIPHLHDEKISITNHRITDKSGRNTTHALELERCQRYYEKSYEEVEKESDFHWVADAEL